MKPQDILIVDDEWANLELIDVLLTSKGHDVATASGANEAAASIARRKPDLILMDLELPGVDGFELTRQLKHADDTRAICIIALTAAAMRGDEARAMAAGCDAYMTKPVDIQTFALEMTEHFTRFRTAQCAP